MNPFLIREKGKSGARRRNVPRPVPLTTPDAPPLKVSLASHSLAALSLMEVDHSRHADRLRRETAIRQRAEEALEASARDFRTFFEMANVGHVIADARTYRFLRVNRCYCE